MGAAFDQRLQDAYVAACELELRAFKPGNVSIYSEGHGMTVEDFRHSARVSAPYLADGRLSLGERIYYAIRATRDAVGCNTNLGIVLLCAPLLQAAQSEPGEHGLKECLQAVLNGTTRTDAEWVYRAIRLAAPGGLGRSPVEDVHRPPQVSLGEAMRLASRRDRIAFQYGNGYADIFEFAIPRYHSALSRWGDPQWAAVAVYVGLLGRIPDSHITRKFGERFTGLVATRMAALDQALATSARPGQAMQLLKDVDAEFKSVGINPGTTADLTVTSLLIVDLEALRRCPGKERRAFFRLEAEPLP